MAVATAFVVLAVVTAATAQESNVLLMHPSAPTPLLREALVHVRGEFASVGLGVQVVDDFVPGARPEFSPGTYGALAFEERQGLLVIRAYHPGSDEPIVQKVRTGPQAPAPHVVAVRAVEALRAALQQYYYTTNKNIPEVVKKMARIKERAPPQPPPSPAPSPAPAREASLAAAPPALCLWLAPSLWVDVSNQRAAGGALAKVSVGRGWYSAGIAFEASLLPFRFQADSGTARVQRLVGELEVRGRLPLSSSLAGFIQAGGGLGHYRVQGSATAGYVAVESTHRTPLGFMGLGLELWLTSHLGLFAVGQVSLALDAPLLRFAGDPGDPLERPLLGLSIGVVIGSGR